MAKEPVRDIAADIDELDRQVAELEAEKAGLPTPVSWDELQEAGALQRVEETERRRGIIPRLLDAAKVKRLQLELERLERRLEPIAEEQAQAYKELEETRLQVLELQEKQGRAQHAYSHATMRRQKVEGEQRRVRQQLREIQQ
jgi:hypothetical protein